MMRRLRWDEYTYAEKSAVAGAAAKEQEEEEGLKDYLDVERILLTTLLGAMLVGKL